MYTVRCGYAGLYEVLNPKGRVLSVYVDWCSADRVASRLNLSKFGRLA